MARITAKQKSARRKNIAVARAAKKKKPAPGSRAWAKAAAAGINARTAGAYRRAAKKNARSKTGLTKSGENKGNLFKRGKNGKWERDPNVWRTMAKRTNRGASRAIRSGKNVMKMSVNQLMKLGK